MPGGSYDQGTKQARVVLRNLTTVRFALCEVQSPPAPFRRMHDFVCTSIPRIHRYGAGNVCSRLIEFPALRSFIYARLEIVSNVS